MVLVLAQPDLGTALILLLIFVTICALTRIAWRSLVRSRGGVAVGLPLVWMYVLKDYQKSASRRS
jgi:rod shape determining protein RodA